VLRKNRIRDELTASRDLRRAAAWSWRDTCWLESTFRDLPVWPASLCRRSDLGCGFADVGEEFRTPRRPRSAHGSEAVRSRCPQAVRLVGAL